MLLWLATVAVAGFIVFTGWLSAIQGNQLGHVRLMLAHNPVGALKVNLAAVQAFDWPLRVRFQLMLTLNRLMVRDHERVQLQPEAADAFYRIAATAMPHHPATLATRAEYLINSGRWKEPETEEILARLRKHARLQAGTWLVEMFYAIKVDDGERANRALGKLMTIRDIYGRVTLERFTKALKKGSK